jgi:hypothetical protein
MSFSVLIIVGAIFFLTSISMLLSIQHQLLRTIGECSICRREIMTNEEIISCPICHTIYHSIHLTIWLKIKKKCPICKNQIKNNSKEGYLRTNKTCQKKTELSGTLPIRWNYLYLECPHCHTNFELSVNTASDQCQICGSNIYWFNGAQSLKLKMKNSYNLYSKVHQIRRKNKGKSINKLKIKQINKRKIKRIKEQERKRQQEFLQEQTRLELLDDIALISEEYFKETEFNSISNHYFAQNVYEESNRKEKSHVPNLNMIIITFIMQIIIFGIIILLTV